MRMLDSSNLCIINIKKLIIINDSIELSKILLIKLCRVHITVLVQLRILIWNLHLKVNLIIILKRYLLSLKLI